VSVFEAHAEFLQWYARGEDVNCFGLFPLFSEAPRRLAERSVEQTVFNVARV